MNRRDSMALLVLAAASAPSVAFAQPKSRVWRVGNVHGVSPRVAKPYEDAFFAGMKERGYEIGRNLIFDQRYSDGDPARYPALVDELIALKPDILIGANTGVARVMMSRTTAIPIVLATSGDPVGDGLVQSLARPGGNVTGVSLQLSEFGAKHIELLGDLLPHLRRAALIVDSGPTVQVEAYERLAKSAAGARGYALQIFRIGGAEDMRSAFGKIEAQRPDAVAVFLSPRLNSIRLEICQRATAMRLPSIAHHEGYAQDGGLMSYGPSFIEGWRRVPYFVDRILKGAKPGELPVEQPTKFVLTINAATARALGVKIPDVIRVRADQVIE